LRMQIFKLPIRMFDTFAHAHYTSLHFESDPKLRARLDQILFDGMDG
jgi:hypothetical protein